MTNEVARVYSKGGDSVKLELSKTEFDFFMYKYMDYLAEMINVYEGLLINTSSLLKE